MFPCYQTDAKKVNHSKLRSLQEALLSTKTMGTYIYGNSILARWVATGYSSRDGTEGLTEVNVKSRMMKIITVSYIDFMSKPLAKAAASLLTNGNKTYS